MVKLEANSCHLEVICPQFTCKITYNVTSFIFEKSFKNVQCTTQVKALA